LNFTVICNIVLTTFIFIILLLGFVYASVFYKFKEAKQAVVFDTRNLTVFPLVATLVTSQYGWINGVFEVYFDYGVPAWLILSLPYLLLNLAWIFLSKYLRNQGIEIKTTHHLLRHHYGKWVAIIGSLLYVFALMPFMYIHMGGQVLSSFLNISWFWAVLIFAILSALAFFKEGFKNVVKQDQWMFFAMFIGLFIILISLWLKEPHVQSLQSFIPRVQFNRTMAIEWYLLALIVFIDPAVHQRIWSAKDNHTSKKAFGYALVFWLLFDILVIGIVSQVRTLDASILSLQGIFTILDPWQQLVLAILSVAVILSTANTYFFIATSTLTDDLLKVKSSVTRWVLGLLAMLAIGLVIYLRYEDKTVVAVLFDFYPIVISTLVFPMVFALLPLPKLLPWQVLMQMIIAGAICVAIQLELLKIPIFEAQSAIIYGMIAAALVQILFQLFNYVISKKKR